MRRLRRDVVSFLLRIKWSQTFRIRMVNIAAAQLFSQTGK